MIERQRPYVREMVKEAVEKLGGKATYGAIINYIRSKYGDVNETTIRCQIIISTVNHPSRIHYPENKRPRICSDSRYDFLYSVGRGEVVQYDSEKHGQWEIVRKGGKLVVAPTGIEEEIPMELEKEEEVAPVAFPLESHLRDFLARNLETVEKGLKLFQDENGREGVEYPTETGPIDILAEDKKGDFVVFELKVSRGQDRAIGQLMRYMGWVRQRKAGGRKVRGVILAQKIEEGLKYAASENPNIRLLEYEISFKVKPIEMSVIVSSAR